VLAWCKHERDYLGGAVFVFVAAALVVVVNLIGIVTIVWRPFIRIGLKKFVSLPRNDPRGQRANYSCGQEFPFFHF